MISSFYRTNLPLGDIQGKSERGLVDGAHQERPRTADADDEKPFGTFLVVAGATGMMTWRIGVGRLGAMAGGLAYPKRIPECSRISTAGPLGPFVELTRGWRGVKSESHDHHFSHLGSKNVGVTQQLAVVYYTVAALYQLGQKIINLEAA